MKSKNAGNGNEPESAAASEESDRAALIARRAYEKWQARGCPDGDDRRDWFEAEQELLVATTAQSDERGQPAGAKRPNM